MLATFSCAVKLGEVVDPELIKTLLQAKISDRSCLFRIG
jgi:hypothetical protein